MLVAVTSCVMFNFGLRVSNVAHNSSSKGKHAIRRKHVIFEDICGRRFGIVDYVKFLKETNKWKDFNSSSQVVCIVFFSIDSLLLLLSILLLLFLVLFLCR